MSYVHEKYKTELKGKTTKAVVAMLCKMKTISLLEILFYLECSGGEHFAKA